MQNISPFFWKQDEFFYDTINGVKYKQLPQISNHKKFVLDKILKAPKTLSFKFIPTWSCNLRCPYCFVLKKLNKNFVSEKPNLEKLSNFISWHKKQYNSNELIGLLIGGEPTLYPDICLDYIDLIHNCGGKMHMTSNLSVPIDDKILKIFSLLDGCQVSIDGPEDIHNKSRIPYKNDFNIFRLIIKNLKILKEHNLLDKLTASTAFRLDLYNEKAVFELKLILKSLGLKNIQIGTASESSYFDKSKSRKFTGMNIMSMPCCSFRYMSDFVIQGNKIFADYFDTKDVSFLGTLDDDFNGLPLKYESYLKNNMPILKDETCLSCPALPICWGQCVGHTLFDDFSPSKFCYQDVMIQRMNDQMNRAEYINKFDEINS